LLHLQRDGFTIWNAGKEGKRLYRSLSAAARAAVVAFADVDARKLAQGAYDDMQGRRRVPILHFRRVDVMLRRMRASRCADVCACAIGMRRRRCCCA
jgi:hypothetical protein